MNRVMRGVAAAACLVAAVGCKKKGGGGGDAVDAAPQVAAPALRPVGADDPFARLTGDSVRQLNNGYRALRVKDWANARTAFEAVTVASPDYAPARYQLARTLALSGAFADVPDVWAALIARDYVGWAGKLGKAKDMAPLRASPAWAKIEQAERDYRTLYVDGFSHGVFFVARDKAPAHGLPPVDKATDADVVVDPQQEAWHFDPAGQKYRRVTETSGHVWAIAVSPDRKKLSFVVARKVRVAPDPAGALGYQFSAPEVGFVDLATLETVGPFKLDGTPARIDFGFSDAGEPAWIADEVTWVIDSAHTAAVKAGAQGAPKLAGAETVAEPGRVWQERIGLVGARLSPDATALSIDGAAQPVRAARPIDPASLEWSPGKKRLTYAGVFDACKAVEGKAKEARNELYVWDAGSKSASRVAAAVSYFDTAFLDDDKLVYEGGAGKEGKLHIIDLPTRNDVALKTRSGAGLVGIQELYCEPQAPAKPDEAGGDVPADDEEGD